MANYTVQLINPELNLDATITVPADQYILDIADDVRIRLPSGCRQGNCSTCVAKLIQGEVDQTEQQFLSPAEVAAGYTVTCIAVPLSDCILLTHQEQALYQSALYFQRP